MRKALSFLTFILVLYSVMFGSEYLISQSIKDKPNTVIAVNMVNSLRRQLQPEIIALNTNRSESAVLGASTLESRTISSNALSNSCVDALVKHQKNKTSIVRYLNSIGQDSSYQHRQQLAQEFGLQNYTGTINQNNQLLVSVITKNLCLPDDLKN